MSLKYEPASEQIRDGRSNDRIARSSTPSGLASPPRLRYLFYNSFHNAFVPGGFTFATGRGVGHTVRGVGHTRFGTGPGRGRTGSATPSGLPSPASPPCLR